MAVCGKCVHYDGDTKSRGKGYCTSYGTYVWPDDASDCRRYEPGGQSSSGGCYLTSACVCAKGLPDDCRELTMLRQFRDGYVAQQADGKELIASYYEVAPRIVAAIDARADALQIWQRVYEELVQACLSLIEAGRAQEALTHYRAYSLMLQKNYAPNA